MNIVRAFFFVATLLLALGLCYLCLSLLLWGLYLAIGLLLPLPGMGYEDALLVTCILLCFYLFIYSVKR